MIWAAIFTTMLRPWPALPAVPLPARQWRRSTPAQRCGPAVFVPKRGRSFKFPPGQAVVGQHSLQSGDLGRNIHGYVRKQIVIQVLIRLIQGMQDARDIPADGLGVFALLPLYIVIGVQQLEGSGEEIIAAAMVGLVD